MKPTLIFFLDAIRYDYLEGGYLPYVRQIAKGGSYRRLRTLLAFEGIAATAYTGVYPNQHLLWTQFVLDGQGQFNWLRPYMKMAVGLDRAFGVSRKLKKVFRYLLLRVSSLSGNLGYFPSIGEIPLDLLPRFGVATGENLLTADAINGYPTFLSVLRRNGFSVEIIDHPPLGSDYDVVEQALRIKRPKDVTVFRLWDLDSVTHRSGTGSGKTEEAILKTDDRVRSIIEHFEHNRQQPVRVFVFADHGVTNVTRSLDLMKILGEEGLNLGDEYLGFFDSTMARFWGSDEAIARIAKALQGRSEGRVLDDRDYELFHIPRGKRYGQLIFLAKPGVIILPNYFQGDETVAGMHGYDPSIPDMDTIFVTNVPLNGSTETAASMVDVAPTILGSFGLASPSSAVGRSLLA